MGAVLLFALIYFVNVPGIQASGDIIDGFRSQTPQTRVAEFEQALSRGSFAEQEIREQFIRNTQGMITDNTLPQNFRDDLRARVEEEIEKQIEKTPNDARVRIFASSFYRAIGESDLAIEHLNAGIEASPNKQQLLLELGLAHFQRNDYENSAAVFKRTYELEPEFLGARLFYAGSLLYLDKFDEYDALITDEIRETDAYLASDFILAAAFDKKLYDTVIDVLEKRVAGNPGNLQMRVSLAVAYNDKGDLDNAIRVLEEAIAAFPSFREQGGQYINNLRAGVDPSNTHPSQ